TFGNRLDTPLRTFPPRPWRHSVTPPVGIEVAGDVAERPDAIGLRSEADQLLHRLLARGYRRIEGCLGDDALGEVVESFEAAASGDGDEAGVVQLLKRRFPGAPAPPVSRTLARN